MKIVVASGKGGVGKSMLASSLTLLFAKEKKVMAVDGDVDAPNMGLWLGVKKFDSEEKISTSKQAIINPKKCVKCGKCFEICRFQAVEKEQDKFKVNPFLCEGCNACVVLCPAQAIRLKKVNNALIQFKQLAQGFPLISGQLLPGESGSGDIVAELRRRAENQDFEVLVLDCSPGIGCPVTAAITNMDFAVLVTEPTPSGLSDLKRVLLVVNHFKIPFGIVINQWDINPEFSEKIERFAGQNLLGKISHDKKVIESIVALKPVLESDSKVIKEIKSIFARLKERTGLKK